MNLCSLIKDMNHACILGFGHSMQLEKCEARFSYPTKVGIATIGMLSKFTCSHVPDLYQYIDRPVVSQCILTSHCESLSEKSLGIFSMLNHLCVVVLLFLEPLTAEFIFRTCTAECFCEYRKVLI